MDFMFFKRMEDNETARRKSDLENPAKGRSAGSMVAL